MRSAGTTRALSTKGFSCLILFFLASTQFPQRVVSLAPGLTEIVFALGRGGLLVGVTKFCDYPLAARRIKKIGGFLDINREALVALAPDIILCYPEHHDKLEFLEQRARVIMVRHERLAEILRSISDVGKALHAETEAKRLIGSIQGKLRSVASQCRGKKVIRTLLVAGRNAGSLQNLYIIGKKDFFNDLLEISGGKNVYSGEIEYPSISLESAILLAPEFIFEISAHYEGIPERSILSSWQAYDMIPAVARRQIRIIRESFWLRPGPRVAMIAEGLARFFMAAGTTADMSGAGHD